MGQCGCGEGEPVKIIKVSGNLYVVVYLLSPCNYCDAGFQINIAKMNKEDFLDYGLRGYKDLIIDIKDLSEIGEIINIVGGEESFRNTAKELLSEDCADEFLDNIYMLLLGSHEYLRRQLEGK